MYYSIQKLILGFFLALFSVQLFAKPLNRDKAVECAAASLIAGSYFKEREEREELIKAANQSFYHFISHASYLDTSNNPKEAAKKAVSDAYKIAARLNLNLNEFTKKGNLCTDMFVQHMEGVASALEK